MVGQPSRYNPSKMQPMDISGLASHGGKMDVEASNGVFHVVDTVIMP